MAIASLGLPKECGYSLWSVRNPILLGEALHGHESMQLMDIKDRRESALADEHSTVNGHKTTRNMKTSNRRLYKLATQVHTSS